MLFRTILVFLFQKNVQKVSKKIKVVLNFLLRIMPVKGFVYA